MLNLTNRGEQTKCAGGEAVRDTREDQGRYDLLPSLALMRIALWYELGAKKYEDRNWEKGMKYSRYLDSALRHIFKHLAGLRDEDHLVAATWNLLGIIHTEEQVIRGKLPAELDDLPCHVTPEEQRNGIKGPLEALLKHYEQTIPKGDDNGTEPETGPPGPEDPIQARAWAAYRNARYGRDAPTPREFLDGLLDGSCGDPLGRAVECNPTEDGPRDREGLDARPKCRRSDLPGAVQVKSPGRDDTPDGPGVKVCSWRHRVCARLGRYCRLLWPVHR